MGWNKLSKAIGTGILIVGGFFLNNNADSKQYGIHPVQLITYPLGVCSEIEEFGKNMFGERQEAELVPTSEYLTSITREEAGLGNSDLEKETRQEDFGLESGEDWEIICVVKILLKVDWAYNISTNLKSEKINLN